jgi:hypothetical protein
VPQDHPYAQKLERQLEHFEASVDSLNVLTDTVTEKLTAIEDRLRAANSGVDTYVFDTPVFESAALRNSDGYTHSIGAWLGWSKGSESGRWELTLWHFERSCQPGQPPDQPTIRADKTQALLSASRELKIAAIQKLSLLLEKMQEEVSQLTSGALAGLSDE